MELDWILTAFSRPTAKPDNTTLKTAAAGSFFNTNTPHHSGPPIRPQPSFALDSQPLAHSACPSPRRSLNSVRERPKESINRAWYCRSDLRSLDSHSKQRERR